MSIPPPADNRNSKANAKPVYATVKYLDDVDTTVKVGVVSLPGIYLFKPNALRFFTLVTHIDL
jgi:hypothetical protein